MKSPRSKLRGITSASLRYADNKGNSCFLHPTLQAAGNVNLKSGLPKDGKMFLNNPDSNRVAGVFILRLLNTDPGPFLVEL